MGVGLAALLGAHHLYAADHGDSPTLTATGGGNPMADLNDVYAWMTSDGAKINLALTVSPADDGTQTFGPSVLYAFHVTSKSAFPIPGMPAPAAVESKVICKFATNTSGECWVVNADGNVADYLQGDFSTTGVSSPSGKIRVFAGQRSDPFFFNLLGFKAAVGAAIATCGNMECPGTLTTDAAGCPALTTAQATALRGAIGSTVNTGSGFCPGGQVDCFLNLNVMAIVIQIDKGLVLSGSDTLVSVWASTHAGA